MFNIGDTVTYRNKLIRRKAFSGNWFVTAVNLASPRDTESVSVGFGEHAPVRLRRDIFIVDVSELKRVSFLLTERIR